jgi:hypothetical protein
MKRWFCFVLSLISIPLCFVFSAQPVYGASSEMDILLKKLVEKGIFTPSEAESLGKEVQAAAAAQKEAEKKELKELASKESGVPDWVKNTKFKGDLRLRYEARDRQDDVRGTQGRGRFRLRAGAETAINEQVTVGFGLASGTGDQRSANQTFGNAFNRKSIWVDYAYAKYAPVKWFSLTGGKFANPIWQPSDMLISADINPEGAALKVEGQMASNIALFFNGGVFVLNDSNGSSPSTADPLISVFQPGVKWNMTKDTFIRFAPAYYVYSDLKGTKAFNATNYPAGYNNVSLSSTNTATTAGNYAFNYSAINWAGEVGFTNPFCTSWIPYLSIMGGYLQNPDPSHDNTAYLAGFSIGYPDVKKAWDWSLEYTFRRLEKDASLDLFPDSSYYNGNTNVMGHRVKLLFGVAKNTALGLNYYNTWLVRKYNPTSSTTIPAATRSLSSKENLFQADLLVKF